jgi:hypothetical protein
MCGENFMPSVDASQWGMQMNKQWRIGIKGRPNAV